MSDYVHKGVRVYYSHAFDDFCWCVPENGKSVKYRAAGLSQAIDAIDEYLMKTEARLRIFQADTHEYKGVQLVFSQVTNQYKWTDATGRPHFHYKWEDATEEIDFYLNTLVSDSEKD